MALKPIGYDWFLLDKEPVDSLDNADYAAYISSLAGEIGVKAETAVGSRTTYPAKTIPDVEAVRVHLTHLPLLGGREAVHSHLTDLAAPRLYLRDKNPEWWAELDNYQVQSAMWCASRQGSIIADYFGLGKTREALAALCPTALVLCTKSGISVWQDECDYAGLSWKLLEGKAPPYREVADFFKEYKADTQVWIVNYHIAQSWVPYFCSMGPAPDIHTIVVDEAHYLQKPRLAWAQAINGIERERCILLTATPIHNRLRSLWSLLNTACPKAFGSMYEFRKAICGAEDGGYGLVDAKQITPETLRRFQLRLSECLLKRTGEQVGRSLVPHYRWPHYVELNDAAYREALSESKSVAKALYGRAGATVARYTDLRKRFGLLKVAEAARLTAELLPKWKRAVVWVWHDDVAVALEARLKELLPDIPIDEMLGKTSQKKRDAVHRAWRASRGMTEADIDSRILVASIGAASEAVGFTTAGLAIFVELDWAPLHMQQSEKRTHRRGQMHKKCESFYLVLKNTIDETISEVLLEKAQECEAVLGVDGQVEQMQTLFGKVASEGSDTNDEEEFMASVAKRLLGTA